MQTQAPSYAVRPPKRIGGSLSLDFVNTEAWRGDVPQRGERLTGYDELALWAGHLGIVDRAGARRLAQEAAQRPEAAAAVLATALRLRGALGRILTAPEAAAPEDLAVLNAVLARAPTRTGLAPAKAGFSWTMTETDPLEQPLWPVVWDAADLLVSGRAERVGSCSDPDCAWVFLDTSRNRSRRWCSMADCGNRHKARRHYERSRAS